MQEGEEPVHTAVDLGYGEEVHRAAAEVEGILVVVVAEEVAVEEEVVVVEEEDRLHSVVV